MLPRTVKLWCLWWVPSNSCTPSLGAEAWCVQDLNFAGMDLQDY